MGHTMPLRKNIWSTVIDQSPLDLECSIMVSWCVDNQLSFHIRARVII
jgi:hypothetical protein